MGAARVDRIAVMSIHPQYAEAILDGSKRVEFRKRRLAPDVSTVLIYATQPVGRIVGAFVVGGYDIATPTALWERHKGHAGISRERYRAYYRATRTAVGILVQSPRRFDREFTLREIDETMSAPQSFLYLTASLASLDNIPPSFDPNS